jgi:hypothetical protein
MHIVQHSSTDCATDGGEETQPRIMPHRRRHHEDEVLPLKPTEEMSDQCRFACAPYAGEAQDSSIRSPDKGEELGSMAARVHVPGRVRLDRKGFVLDVAAISAFNRRNPQ